MWRMENGARDCDRHGGDPPPLQATAYSCIAGSELEAFAGIQHTQPFISSILSLLQTFPLVKKLPVSPQLCFLKLVRTREVSFHSPCHPVSHVEYLLLSHSHTRSSWKRHPFPFQSIKSPHLSFPLIALICMYRIVQCTYGVCADNDGQSLATSVYHVHWLE